MSEEGFSRCDRRFGGERFHEAEGFDKPCAGQRFDCFQELFFDGHNGVRGFLTYGRSLFHFRRSVIRNNKGRSILMRYGRSLLSTIIAVFGI